MISEPVFMECYADNSRGDTLDKVDIRGQFARIFDESFFHEVNLLANDSERLRSSVQMISSFWVLSINVNYPDEYNDRSRLFKIRILSSGMEWVLIQCAG